jgi:ketosteroid isomerase-like protein
MNLKVRRITIPGICILALLTRSTGWSENPAQTSAPSACAALQYHQFDFWVGNWEAYDADDLSVPVAHARVDRILDGCVLHEDYRGTNGSHGESFTILDTQRNVWHQSWVTNRGALLVIEGQMQNGAMTLSGEDRTPDGKQRLVRGTWTPVKGGVSEVAVLSTDGGKTWTPWFDLIFRPATGEKHASADGDEATIIALDGRYQAAVKKNDATTMAEILADDFILRTGSGKSFTKADLLEEARGGRFVYEHQDDSEQTVRVWNDTAVITAKLWEKGTENGKSFDYTVWFSDTYLRTGSGWRYVFGQSSLPLHAVPGNTQ